ncbi:MAG: carbohydrate ABC transporter permease [Planctomycetota bacterium]|jgi:multiple sugar transport system permease protein
MNFVKTLAPDERILDSSEVAYQRFLLQKYGNLAGVNKAYGWNLKAIEEAFPRLDIAYTVTFLQNESAFTLEPIFANYKVIFDYLILNGRAVPVTILLVGLAILMTLTINPMAAYALSRFNLPGQSKIILFMLATMAFPAMVSAIPAYLLMRDLGLLNTFAALVLPSAANGMAIFILKGFFDSLPQELFEAATIDGASEIQIFRIVAMPLVKPILAINCINAFITAYNGWQWALIICQDKEMWTLAVWMYQASQWWIETPWIVSAGFAVTSIPTMIVFLSCQKIILRGIVIPSMK